MALPPDTRPVTPQAGGRGMVVDRAGSGPPVLLVHGLGGPAMWEKVVPLLAPFREVFVPHLYGFGESPAPRAGMSAAGHAATLGELVSGMGQEKFTVAGVSYGGQVATHFCVLAAGRVSRLVLVCPTGMERHPAGRGARPALRRALSNPRVRGWLRRFITSPAIAGYAGRRAFHEIANRPPDLVARTLAQLRRPGHADAMIDALGEIVLGEGNLGELLDTLSVPVTIAHGGNDRVIPPPPTDPSDGGRPTAANARGAIMIPECGHAVPMEKPQILTDIILGTFHFRRGTR